jgi:hypothetical protein
MLPTMNSTPADSSLSQTKLRYIGGGPLIACFKSQDGLFAHADANGQLQRSPTEELASGF